MVLCAALRPRSLDRCSSASSHLLLTQAANAIASVGWQLLLTIYCCNFCTLEVGWELLAILILISITKSVSYHDKSFKAAYLTQPQYLLLLICTFNT